MKKLGILMMPLMAMSLLASCGSKSVDPLKIDLYKKETMYDGTGKKAFSITQREYDNKHLVKKEIVTSPDDPNVKDVYEYTYDKHENETKMYYALYDGEEKTDEGWEVTEYTYDEQNRVTKQLTKMSLDNVEWTVFEHYEYEYQENVTIEKDFGIDGDLECTTTYTYDKKGNLINEKIMYNPTSEYNVEKVYTVDENGCATTIIQYTITSSGERKIMFSVTEITYLKKLWYRPLKETVTYCASANSTTTEREYDSKNRIKLYKIYDGIEEGPTPSYGYYATYEY